jgi:hypothetical protein
MTLPAVDDPIRLADMLLENAGVSNSVYVVCCGGDKVGWMPRTVRRQIQSAMMFCIAQWSVVPEWSDPGYWRAELEADGKKLVIEIFELALET